MTSLANDDSALSARMASTRSSSVHWCDRGNVMSFVSYPVVLTSVLFCSLIGLRLWTDHEHQRLTLPQRNVNCFATSLHFTAGGAYVVCKGRRDNHDGHFTSHVYLPCIMACTFPPPLTATVCRQWSHAHISDGHHVDGGMAPTVV